MKSLENDPVTAAVLGITVAITVPLLFRSAGPELQSLLPSVWLAGTGLLMGTMVYRGRRAAPYLRDVPGRWDLFRGMRLLNEARYHEEGRGFVRWLRRVTLILPFWWLGGGVVVLSTMGAAQT